MGLVRKTAICILAVIVMAPGLAGAAQDNYEIDLKELGPAKTKAKPQTPSPATGEIDLKELRKIAPPQTAKPTHHKHHSQPAAAPETASTPASGQESIYVVQPGDHLFQILMKQYGLSDPAAERLIPEVMKLNGITSPKGLKVGQRLRIPLPAREGKHSVSQPASAPKTRRLTAAEPKPAAPAPAPAQAPAPVQTPAPAPVIVPVTTQTPAPAPSAVPATVPAPAAVQVPTTKPAAPPTAVSISIVSASPCELARDMAKKMRLLSPSPTGIQGVDTVGMTNAGRSVAVACGISKAEQYTYERLLARSGKQLLVFEGDEADECVVEQLAEGLGLVFRKSDTDTEELPMTYIFAPFGSWSQEVQLTILPVQEPPAPPVTDKPKSGPIPQSRDQK